METQNCQVNNEFYDELNSYWHEGSDHPIALLRAENKIRNPWIQEAIQKHFNHPISILDVGCGGGLLTGYLKDFGHKVTGVDLSNGSLEVARNKDKENLITYLEADALKLPFDNESFDVVCLMDLLEHVSSYQKALEEASRVLKKGGLLFFHTFNRNLVSHIVIIKGVEWFVKNTPKNLHVYSFFIKPKELGSVLENQGLKIETLKGLIPDAKSLGFWRMLFKKELKEDFRFKFSKSLLTGYVGMAKK